MTHPKKAKDFKVWSQMMLEQALVPDRLQYKPTSGKSSGKGMKTSTRRRRKRFQRKRRRKD